MLKRVFINIKKFGFIYTFFFILHKLNFIKDIPLKFILKKQQYYLNMTDEEKIKELSYFYKISTGHTLNINNPTSFSEKIQWLKLYDSTKEKGDLSDKYLAPQIVKKLIGNDINTIPLLGCWNNADEIDFDKLPNSFVLKCNHGSAMNIIVKDKTKLNIVKTKQKLNNWIKIDYSIVNGMFEDHYKYIEHKIIAEKYIEEVDGNLYDYKFHCFNGTPVYCQLIGDRIPNTHICKQAFYNMNWEKENFTCNNHIMYNREFDKPELFEKMKSIAKVLSQHFKYVRVDFYIIDNNIYFGELTFTPASGIFNFNKPGIDFEWGNLLEI